MFSKSPSFARKGHQQLTGNDADEKDRIVAGVQYSVHYVGSIEVASVNGTGSRKTEIPVAKVFEQHKKNGKVLKKMIMTICSKNLSVSEESSGKLVAHFPVTKITFCNFDTVYEKAFVFIARDRVESPFKAFVFSCESKAKAREAFKALSLAFTINYESYQASLIRVPNLNDKAKPTDEKNSAMVNGMPVVKVEEEPRGQALAQNFRDTLPKRLSVPHQNGVPTPSTANPPALLAPIQHKRLLEIVDNRGRSISDPPFSRTRALPVFQSQPSIDYPACNLSCPYPIDKRSLDIEDDEFTEFAELRSKSRSSTNLSSNQNGNFSGALLRYDSAPNVWGGFQSACPQIY